MQDKKSILEILRENLKRLKKQKSEDKYDELREGDIDFFANAEALKGIEFPKEKTVGDEFFPPQKTESDILDILKESRENLERLKQQRSEDKYSELFGNKNEDKYSELFGNKNEEKYSELFENKKANFLSKVESLKEIKLEEDTKGKSR